MTPNWEVNLVWKDTLRCFYQRFSSLKWYTENDKVGGSEEVDGDFWITIVTVAKPKQFTQGQKTLQWEGWVVAASQSAGFICEHGLGRVCRSNSFKYPL